MLQEPDLRDFQDLPDLDVAQFRRTVAAQTEDAASVGCRTFRMAHLLRRTRRRRRRQDEPLGWVSLRIAERTPTGAEIGYSVVRDYRGRGIATEAVAALVGEGFEQAHLQQVRAYCVPENAHRARSCAATGFHDEGTVRHGATVQGQAVDVVAHASIASAGNHAARRSLRIVRPFDRNAGIVNAGVATLELASQVAPTAARARPRRPPATLRRKSEPRQRRRRGPARLGRAGARTPPHLRKPP